MKRIIIVLGLVFISFTLTSCVNSKNDEFSVVYYTGLGATVVETAYDLKEGDKIPKPEIELSDAGVFAGWFTETEYINEWNFESDTLSKSITIYAKWEYSSFTITYDLRGGNWPDNLTPGLYPETYTYFSSFNFPVKVADYPVYPKNDPENPYKGLFLGWWEEPDLNRTQRKDTPKTESIVKGSTGNKVFYAYYSQDK